MGWVRCLVIPLYLLGESPAELFVASGLSGEMKNKIPKHLDVSVMKDDGDEMRVVWKNNRYEVTKWKGGKIDESYRPLNKSELKDLLEKSLS